MRLFPPEFEPKLATVFREGYSAQGFTRDALAGVVVGTVAFPLGIAFAIASGVRPEQGIYTAIIAGLAISLFGGSRVQIGGPTGAFVVLVAAIVGEFGYQGLAVATLMAGCFLAIMALARLGDVIRFMPYPVTVGFTTGIAVIIATTQVGDALGLETGVVPADFLAKLSAYAANIQTLNVGAAATFLGTVAIIQLWPKVTNRIPGPMVALVASTAIVHMLGLNVETIHSRFGDVPSSFPSFRLLEVDWNQIPDLVSPAITIALLAAIESLLSAVVADGLIGGRHRSNAELLAQGIANVASPLFGGIPATGAIARTATNVRNGGRTPIAGIVHAATLLAILVFAGRWASLIPMATMAGILVVVAYNMSEWHVFLRLLSGPRSDALVLLATFFLTVVVDLTVAIQVGVVLASLLFMRRMAEVTEVKPIRDIVDYDKVDLVEDGTLEVPAEVDVFEINGSFCFGAASKFTETLLASQGTPTVVILRMRYVLAIDATGLHALEEVANRLRHRGAHLLLSGLHAQPLVAMERSGALARIGEDQLFGSFADAVSHARRLVDEAKKHS
ncbi:MAG: sodium-independent anion transporter [Gemmatimonadota bacterium]|nr:MAG: sodium-independent anion transporter [Gemmatimonadota bacterium]